MFTARHKDEFERLGVARFPEILPAGDVRDMSDRLWRALGEDHKVFRDDPPSWRAARPSGFQRLIRSDAFAAIASPAVVGVLDALFGAGQWQPPRHWGQPLLCFPTPGLDWDVPHRHWHLDIPAGDACRTLPGVRLFAFLERVEPRAGGTLVVTGSHRLVQALGARSEAPAVLRSAQVRKALMRSTPFIRSLCSPPEGSDRVREFMGGTARQGDVPLTVAELTGEPGDVVVMDLRVLHALAPNCGSRPRLLLGQHIYRAPRVDSSSGE